MEPIKYGDVVSAFNDETVIKKDSETLQKFLLLIANNATGDDAAQARDIVQGLTINHILLQRHIEKIENGNRNIQIIIVILMIISIATSCIQIWITEKNTAKLPAPQQQSQVQLQATNPYSNK